MMIRKYIYILFALMLAACSDDEMVGLSPIQQSLLGKSVNFNATRDSEFNHQTRATYNDTGVFNEDDLMRIYRQYAQDGGGWDQEAYRTYYFHTKYATGTTISLGRDWRVYKGRKGKNPGEAEFEQGEKDSITWENGKTVRFRSWTRSNYSAVLSSCYKYKSSGITNYYPDFCISDWVTVSGPTEQVPLTMRHICSRIAFSYRNNGSQFYKVEIATSLDDYKRKDNADTSSNDNSASEANKTDEDAQAELDAVLAAYNRMCMPAGVDIEKSELYAMTKDYWEPLDYNDADSKKLRFLENESASTFYHFGEDTPENVKEKVQRPVFANVNNSCYLITIPYDMSNGDQQGNIIALPPCTRFRVYMRDVNNGDGNVTTGNYEGTYHIFSLKDIVDSNTKQPLYPNGLEMAPGFSYRFYVGYRYGQLTITANDNFSWDKQDKEEDNLLNADVQQPEISTSDYAWWKNTIKNAIPKDGGDFEPKFTISSEKEFIEFINLVNNTAAKKNTGLYRAKRSLPNSDHADNAFDRYYWWYTEVSANKRDTVWVTSAEATELGYLLYESYHPANGTQPAYSQEEYIHGAYPFYDETRDRHYTIKLSEDLDLSDWYLPSIGNTVETPFKGFFDGQMHKLSNVRIQDEYLFKYIDAAAIRNLKIESTHKVSLVKEGTNTCYIVGIDLRAHSTSNSIAEKLTSNEYNNPSYVIGCIHVGDAGGALVGASSNLYMQGCMQAAEGITSNTGALLGNYLPYSSTSNWQYFTPQISFDMSNMKATVKGTPTWGRFMCNYYDIQLSKETNAVGNIKDLYSPLEYIRGRDSYILKAKNDNVLSGEATFASLNSVSLRYAYYGLAPWKAMNYAIYRYNQTSAGTIHKCTAHYENNSTGYVHKYPELLNGEPTDKQYASPLDQNN